MAEAAAGAGDGLAAAAGRIRETAKWLTVSLAGIAGVLLAGSSLSSLGSLELFSGRFWAAVAGAVLAAAGAAVVLYAATRAAITPAVTLSGLAAGEPAGLSATTDASLLANRTDVAALQAEYLKHRAALKAANDAYLAAPDDAKRTAVQVAEAAFTDTHGVTMALLGVASYQAVRNDWATCRGWVALGAALGALGVGVFAYAANPPKDAKGSVASPVILSAGKVGTLDLTDAGAEALTKKLACSAGTSLDALAVVALGDVSGGQDVLVTQPGCKPVRLVLTSDWGAVSN